MFIIMLSVSMTQPDVFISDKLILNQSVLILQLGLDSLVYIHPSMSLCWCDAIKTRAAAVSHSDC